MNEPKPKILLLENIHPRAAKRLSETGFAVKALPQALDAAALRREISDAFIIGIRSKTKLTAEVLADAKKLSAVGAFCIGTDQIDLTAAARRGVAVFNAPYSSARSVVEMVLGEILLLSRGVFAKNRKMHAGTWDKSAAGSHEVRGKKLGIVGYGKIGSQLSVLAEALGMEVHFHDVEEKLVLGNARKSRTLAELLKISDVVTLHVDGRPGNRGLFGRREFNLMKPGAIFINASRG
ncbi:MAG TPA: NAD(P)-dependent oxidoreductase, partial [Elusimicrobiota bacterium]|nr:NAD(P)-dependent oxidoreductase [Elusimicrobiota bacterium]